MKVTNTSMNKKERSTLIKEYMNKEDINTNITIPAKVIEELKLAQPLPRQQRRQIARKANMDWDIYKLLEKETMKRLKKGVDLVTGKSKTDLLFEHQTLARKEEYENTHTID